MISEGLLPSFFSWMERSSSVSKKRFADTLKLLSGVAYCELIWVEALRQESFVLMCLGASFEQQETPLSARFLSIWDGRSKPYVAVPNICCFVDDLLSCDTSCSDLEESLRIPLPSLFFLIAHLLCYDFGSFEIALWLWLTGIVKWLIIFVFASNCLKLSSLLLILMLFMLRFSSFTLSSPTGATTFSDYSWEELWD